MRVLVTGAAGFIGARVAGRLLDRGETVIGLDSLNDYYPVALKHARLAGLQGRAGFNFEHRDLSDGEASAAWIADLAPDAIVHLAAQAGVRASAERPFDFIRSNLMGHAAVLEAARTLTGRGGLRHLVYASSSSVYGDRPETGQAGGAFRETDAVDRPASLYAASKRADELMSEVYASAYGVRSTGLRFFTVYGPMGRPDMAYWRFAEAMLKGVPIVAYGQGLLKRDFTYVDDIVAGVLAVLDHPADAPIHRLYNIGNNRPATVLDLIAALERALGVTARVELADKPSFDVQTTFADVEAMRADFGWAPTTALDNGIARFGAWFKEWAAQDR
jgi:UDP-glucuronate 4-epimerase